MGRYDRSVAERLDERTEQTDGCWNWMGHRNKLGYGVIGVSGQTMLTHRVQWEETFGAIPRGLCVLHHCDNPSCVRPDHLFLGTNADNVRDREQKGRGNQPSGDRNGTRKHPESRPRGDNHPSRKYPELWKRGETHNFARLNQRQVDEIRSEYTKGKTSYRRLAAKYGVSAGAISHIITGRSWRDIRESLHRLGQDAPLPTMERLTSQQHSFDLEAA